MHKSVSRLLLNTWIRKKRSKERREREPPKGFKLKNVLRTADRLVFLNKGPMSLEKRYFSPHLPEVIQQPDPPPHTRSILPGSGVSPIPSSKKKAPTYFLTFVRRWNKMMVVHSRWRNLGGPVVKNPHLSMQGTRIWSLVQARNKFWKNRLRNCYLIVKKKMADLSKERKSNRNGVFSESNKNILWKTGIGQSQSY